MERAEFALRIPPLAGNAREMRNFSRINRRAAGYGFLWLL
jgi:hypothetical protein